MTGTTVQALILLCLFTTAQGVFHLCGASDRMYQTDSADTTHAFTIDYMDGEGFVAFDRGGKALFTVFAIDNGPDYPSEGLFRIIDEGMVGYANNRGEIVIKPQFSAAHPFRNGLAAYCEGCVIVDEGEHKAWKNGKWGFVDTRGNRVIPVQYDKIINDFSHGHAEVVKDGMTITIDRNGKQVQPETMNDNEQENMRPVSEDISPFPGYAPKMTPDTAVDFMPEIRGDIDKIPAATPDNLIALLDLLIDYQKRVTEKPGGWIEGNRMLGARAREYRPTADELMAAAIGDRLQTIIAAETGGRSQDMLRKAQVSIKELEYTRFTFTHTDVMGSGRFFYVDTMEKMKLKLW